jgi:hypothetical protein
MASTNKRLSPNKISPGKRSPSKMVSTHKKVSIAGKCFNGFCDGMDILISATSNAATKAVHKGKKFKEECDRVDYSGTGDSIGIPRKER